jgi:hypothetical protein
MKETLNEVLKEKFMCKERFALEIENIAAQENLNYIDAIILFCEKNEIEVDSVVKLVSKPLKEKLRWDATQLNFLKKTSRARLPL